MAASETWEELNTVSHRKCPKLFYKFAVVDDGYELQLTDITALWIARSTSSEILNHARSSKASIDPSESQSQLEVLCHKLEESIAGGANTLKKDETTHKEAVLLCTSLKLPRPLAPLSWDFLLEPKGALDLAENILKPCLQEASTSLKKIETLINIVDAKDRAIERLLEKIESSSIDLSLVFPGITGIKARKGLVTAKEAQKHVPGLSKFEPQKWSKSYDSQCQYPGFEASGLAKLVSGNERCPKHTPEQHHKWYERLPKATATTSQVAQSSWIRSSSPVRQESEDEFETQKKSRPPRKALSAARQRSDTESEDGKSSGRARNLATTHNPWRRRMSVDIRSSSPELPPSPPMLQRGPTNPTSSPIHTASESELHESKRPPPKKRLGALSNARQHGGRAGAADEEVAQSSSSPIAPAKPSLHTGSSTSLLEPPVGLAADDSTEDDFETMKKTSKSNKQRDNDEASNALHPPSAESTPQKKRDDLESIPESQITPARRKLGRIGGRASLEPDSTQTTPSSRRLGRIGGRNSQITKTQAVRDEPDIDGMDLDKVEEKVDEDDGTGNTESPASTASTTSSPSPRKHIDTSPKPTISRQASGKADSYSTPDQSESEEKNEEESKQEKLARRRAELRQLDANKRNGPTEGPGGVRKKRKF